jgi:hypothetical protein
MPISSCPDRFSSRSLQFSRVPIVYARVIARKPAVPVAPPHEIPRTIGGIKERAMNVHEIRRYQMLTRVREFGMKYSELFATLTLARQMFAAVDATVSAVDCQAKEEASGRRDAREHTVAKMVARAALVDQLAAVRRTAHAFALDGENVRGRFTLPRSPRHLELVAAARAFIADATPLEAEFVAHEMPATFLSDLSAAIDDFESAMRDRHTATGAHITARVGIEASIAAGFLAVRRLDAIVSNQLRGNSALLAAWKAARRVARSPQRARTKDQGRTTDQGPGTDQEPSTKHQGRCDLGSWRLVPTVAVPQRQSIAGAEHDGAVTEQSAEQPQQIPGGMRPHLAA